MDAEKSVQRAFRHRQTRRDKFDNHNTADFFLGNLEVSLEVGTQVLMDDMDYGVGLLPQSYASPPSHEIAEGSGSTRSNCTRERHVKGHDSHFFLLTDTAIP